MVCRTIRQQKSGMPHMRVVVQALPVEGVSQHAIGGRLRLVREQHAVSQRELARRLGVSASYLSAVERGVDKINVDIMKGLVLQFDGLNLDWLITGRGRRFISPADDEIHDYKLDLPAIEAARESFYRSLRGANPNEAARLIAIEASQFRMIYSAYMSRLRALRSEGVPDAEARKVARTECEHHNIVALPMDPDPDA